MKQYKWTDEQLRVAAKKSRSLRGVKRELSLSYNVNNKELMNQIQNLNLDISHFSFACRWTEEELRNAVKESYYIHGVYRLLKVPRSKYRRIVSQIKTLNLDISHFKNDAHLPGNKNVHWKGYREISSSYWYKLQYGSKKRRIPFEITIEQAWSIYEAQNRKCSLSGILIVFPTTAKKHDGTASLDRIDSTKGYIEGNVQWIHKDINYMKVDFQEKEFLNYCKLITQHKKLI